MRSTNFQIAKDYIEVLRKREKYLRKRVADANAAGKDYSFDKHEAAALGWAIAQLEDRAKTPNA